MAKFEMPESLRWYRESAQWIIALSLGGMGGFLGLAGFSEKISGAHDWIRLCFVVAGIAVIVTVIAGVLFYLSITEYGDLLDVEHGLREKLASGTHASNGKNLIPDQKAHFEKELQGIHELKSTANGRYNLWYPVLLWGFVASLVCYLIVGLGLLFSPSNEAESSKYEFTSLYARPTPDHQFQIYILNKNTGELYRLSPTTNVWIRIGGTNRIDAPDSSSMSNEKQNPVRDEHAKTTQTQSPSSEQLNQSTSPETP